MDIQFESITENASFTYMKLFFALRIKKLQRSLDAGSEFTESLENSIKLNQRLLKKVTLRLEAEIKEKDFS